MRAQQVPKEEPSATQTAGDSSSSAAAMPDAPAVGELPVAQPLPESDAATAVTEADSMSGDRDTAVLDGHAELHYAGYTVRADHVTWHRETQLLEAEGHLQLTGGPHDELITASRGTVNLRTGTGTFYDVAGSIGLRKTGHGTTVYSVGNPFLFTGRRVVKSGPEQYEIYNGTVTTCQLDQPEWQLSAAKFAVKDGRAEARNAIFRLRSLPVLLLPYVTHPLDSEQRESGLLIPVISQSNVKGLVLGEQIYVTLGRSADLTVGAQYYSERGWQQTAQFRYRGPGHDFVTARYEGVYDRGFHPATVINGVTSYPYVNQGGEDLLVSGRRDFGANTRIAANAEYLSSYLFREAFSESFNQAVSSDIISDAYGTHERQGYAVSLEADRYQGLKRIATPTVPQAEVLIYHAPSLLLEALDQPLSVSPFRWRMQTELTGLARVQSNFSTEGLSGRFDVHPQLSLPLSLGGFHVRPQVGLRDTYYTRSRVASPLPGPRLPVEVAAGLNRVQFEAEADLRAPVLERDFQAPFLGRVFGSSAARHTVEPFMHFRYATGVSDFNRTLRFDATDVVSDTTQLDYGVTQRLYLRRACNTPVPAGDEHDDAPAQDSCGASLSWRVWQRYYFDDSFGGAVPGNSPADAMNAIRRKVLDSTLDLTGVAFLTDRRNVSPLLSQLRLDVTDHIDLSWDFNYDTHAGRFTQSNTFVNFHTKNYFGALSHARLNAFGRVQDVATQTISPISDFSQMRVLLGYGSPVKQGFSVAANAGIDLKLASVQYGAVQTGYNWNCCGFTAEYRKFQLGNAQAGNNVRNENVYRFSFTLANIGSAGNLRRTERLF